MDSLAARKALLFSAGGVRLALRVSALREVLEVPEREGEAGEELLARGEALPCARVAALLGLASARAPYALLVEGPPRAALRVEALHGIVDLAGALVFQLPARTFLPSPPPFSGAIVWKGEVALELAVTALGLAPRAPAPERPAPAADAGAPSEREIRFARGDRAFAVPLSLLVQVLDTPRIAPVPLAPPSHLGLLCHGRALLPVLDVAALLGAPRGAPPGRALLLDAGGTAVAVAADRVIGPSEGEHVLRPPWDAVLAP
ncbi:MAG TPA: chemotaxis protein CheW [Anaeromyxobacter sp.]